MKKSKAKAHGAAALRTCSFTFSLLLLAALLPIAQADATAQTYTIPLLGYRWNQYVLGVSVPDSPTWAHDAVIDAMKIWNDAQEWFANTYFPNSGRIAYTLLENTHGSVRVSFVKTSSCVECLGWAMTRSSSGIAIRSEVIILTSLSSSLSDLPPEIVKSVALHEFGHVLGLAHAFGDDDLMSPNMEEGYQGAIASSTMILPKLSDASPSTLDLYAVHILRAMQGRFPKSVDLPTGIPFSIYPREVLLKVTVPNNIDVVVDGVAHRGSIDIYLPIGNHALSVTTEIQIDEGTRMVFYGWKGGTELLGILDWTSPQATVMLVNDLQLEAAYDTQYLFEVKYFPDSDYVTKWYGSGIEASFSVAVPTFPLRGTLGYLGAKQVFQGWFEAGNLVTTSLSGTVQMNGPHTIIARWTVDYTTPLAFMSVLIVGLVTLASYQRLRLRHKAD